MSASLRTQKSSEKTRTWLPLYNRGKLFAALVGAVVCLCTGGADTILDSDSLQRSCPDGISCHEASSVGNTIGNTVGITTSGSAIAAAMNHVGATMMNHVSAFRMQPLAGLDAKRAETVYLKWQAYGANPARLFQVSQSDYEENYKDGYKFEAGASNCYPYSGAWLIKPDVDEGEVASTWVKFSGPSEKNYKSIGLHYCGDTWYYGYQKTTWGGLADMVKEFNALQLAEKLPRWDVELARLRQERRERIARQPRRSPRMTRGYGLYGDYNPGGPPRH